MARLFRLWEKKRGDRRTGSRLLASVGEAMFFAALFVVGAVLLAALVTVQITHSTADASYLSGWAFSLRVLLLVAFLLTGGAGVAYSVLQAGSSAERRSAFVRRAANLDLISDALPTAKKFPHVPRDTNLTNSPGTRLTYRLPIAQSPTWKFFAAAGFCLLSAGTASALLALVIDDFREGRPDWLITVLAAPFVLVALAAVFVFVRQLLAQVSIGPTTVEISDHPLRPGHSYRAFVAQAGQTYLRSLSLSLVCEEEATYQQGTDIRTEIKRVFADRFLHVEKVAIRPGIPFENECELKIPDGVMHSFQANSNSVSWKLVVRCEPAAWPPFERGFRVVVYPKT